MPKRSRSSKSRRKSAGPYKAAEGPQAKESPPPPEVVPEPQPRPIIFVAVVALLLTLMGALLVHTARLESPMMDEPIYLAAGYDYCVLGNFWYNHEHPPLCKLLAGLSMLPLHPDLPTHVDKGSGEVFPSPYEFLFRNRVSSDTLLMRGRAPFIVLTLAFGLGLALWTRYHFGAIAAMLAVAFYALDPGMLAHGKYAGTDMAATVLMFLSVMSWGRFLRTKRRADLILAGLVFGFALAAKFSTLVLFGLLPLLYLVRWWQRPKHYSLPHFTGSVATLFLVGVLVLAASYGPATIHAIGGEDRKLADLIGGMQPVGRAFKNVGEALNLPVHPLFTGLYFQFLQNWRGHPSYLMGEQAIHGWWYYYPIAFAIKTPLAVLLAMAAALGFAARSRLTGAAQELRRIPFEWYLLLIPPIVVFALALRANIDTGLRYLLPIYPFLFAALGAALARMRIRVLIVAVLALLAIEHARVAPHYLAFFNSLIGGSANGPRYLLDSNVDWGQDLKKLGAYVEEHGVENLCLAYWGPARPSDYGLTGSGVPSTGAQRARAEADCTVAISANLLYALAIKPRTYAWLREKEPTDRVGYSIYVFDLTKRVAVRHPVRRSLRPAALR